MTNSIRLFVFVLAIVVIGSVRTEAAVIRVDFEQTQSGAQLNGSTWPLAFKTLREAIELANQTPGDSDEIRVANGTYRPPDGVVPPPSDPRGYSFHIIDRMTIVGGYKGLSAIVSGVGSPDDRDPIGNPTVLSGDLASNDLPGFANLPGSGTSSYADNSYHVVFVQLPADEGLPRASFDGDIIRGGSATNETGGTGLGGGVFVSGGDTHVDIGASFVDCVITGNQAGTAGGGAVAIRSGLRLRRCEASDNRVIGVFAGGDLAPGGGGVFASGPLELASCLFSANRAEWENAQASETFAGGGAAGETAKVINCVFVGNFTERGDGGGLQCGGFALEDPVSQVVNCVFSGNTSTGFVDGMNNRYGGNGGGLSASNTDVRLCSFTNNDATGFGGGASLVGVMVNSIVWANEASELGEPSPDGNPILHHKQVYSDGALDISYCCVQHWACGVVGLPSCTPGMIGSGRTMAMAGGGESESFAAIDSVVPEELASMLGFADVQELSAWLGSLDYEAMFTILDFWFGGNG